MPTASHYASMDVEEGQKLLPSNKREEAQRLRKNLIIWGCLGGILVVLIILAAVTSGPRGLSEAEREEDDRRDLIRILGGDPDVQFFQISRVPDLDHDFLGRPRMIKVSKAAVAADTSRCSNVGVQVLKEGGNAVDAAVATCLCSGVVNPWASGIGGGTFMNIRLADGRHVAIDARETAPAAATPDMFAGKPSNASLRTALGIAVPMELKGLRMAWEMFSSGKVEWERLVQPAAWIAENGFAAHYELLNIMQVDEHKNNVLNTPALREWMAIKDAKTGEWRLPNVGEHCCRNPKLAETLKRVGEDGVEWLYTAEAAGKMAKEIQAAGGIVTADDLKEAEPLVQEPLNMTIGDRTYYTMPPPSSGAAVFAGLKLLSSYSPLNVSSDPLLVQHRMVECMKHAFGLRLSLGDPGVDTSTERYAEIEALIADTQNQTFIDSLKAMLSDEHVLNITQYGGRWNTMAAPLEDHGTTQISVIDDDGNVVSMTSSINAEFGSLVVSPSTGILFNDHMDDFSTPNTSNKYGFQATEANFIAPGKRPLSSMTPVIVVDGEGKVRQVVGASGGAFIFSSVLTVLARQQLLNMSAWDAVVTPKVHHQLLRHGKDVMLYEFGAKYNWNISVPMTVVDYLQAKGNNVEAHENLHTDGLGVVQNIAVGDDGTITAVSDPRKDGAPAGY